MGFKEGKLTRPYSSKGKKMSSMGELTFFLGLQVQQKKDGTFISQYKYVDKILKKFGFTEVKTASTPMETQKPLLKDEDGEEVDVPNDKQKKSVSLMMDMLFGMELELMLAKTINGEVQLHAIVDEKKIIINESTVRRDLQLEDVEDEAIHKELGDSLVRAATIDSSLEAEQDSETMGDTIAQTRFKNVSKHSNDQLLARGNTLRSGEDSLKLKELMKLCTNLQQRVLDLEKSKHSQ
ncbi:retrovirus-related pol polyprotein from transposon TNT 1-94 [Tanacetum coccineum]|uniref:Retrovirus-related pol polyprotein from transposon TNT 1-94 n=1 Tax=Tanacetum coccineum TaxID=301880 RepID=A0ABQ5D3Y1_9ASTR